MTARGEIIIEEPSEDTLKVILSRNWKLSGELPGADKIQQRLESRPGVRNLILDDRDWADWDSGLLTFLVNPGKYCARQKISLISDALPQGAQRLLAFASTVPVKKDARPAHRLMD